MSEYFNITVYVRPESQGSHQVVGRGRYSQVVDSNPRLKAYRERIAVEVKSSPDFKSVDLFDKPVSVRLVFGFLQPQKPKFQDRHAVKPDLDKLCRAVNDALVLSGLITDDSRICCLQASKEYSDVSYVSISVSEAGL